MHACGCVTSLSRDRHFGAKPAQKIWRRSGGDAEFMEGPLHGRLNGIVVEIDGLWIVCAARGSEWLSVGEQGFDGFVVEDEERSHRLETGLHRLVAAGVGGPAGEVLSAGGFFIICGGGGGPTGCGFFFLGVETRPPPAGRGSSLCGAPETRRSSARS